MSLEEDLGNKRAYISAKVELLMEQSKGQRADNRLSAALAETAEIATDRERERRDMERHGNLHARIAYLTGPIGSESSASVIDYFSKWHRMDDLDQQFTLVLSSPGGEVTSGFQLYSFLHGLAQIRPVKIVAAGLCASMATIVHQAASDGLRVIEPECTYLLHTVSGAAAGRSDHIADTTKWFESVNHQMARILAEHSSKTIEEIQAEVDRRERFMSVDEVMEWGLADQVGYAIQ